MKLYVQPNAAPLDPAPYRAQGQILTRIGHDTYTVRSAPEYPKGFCKLADAHWKRLNLPERMKWKNTLARSMNLTPGHEPTWAATISAYRRHLFNQLRDHHRFDTTLPNTLPFPINMLPPKLTPTQARKLRQLISHLSTERPVQT